MLGELDDGRGASGGGSDYRGSRCLEKDECQEDLFDKWRRK